MSVAERLVNHALALQEKPAAGLNEQTQVSVAIPETCVVVSTEANLGHSGGHGLQPLTHVENDLGLVFEC